MPVYLTSLKHYDEYIGTSGGGVTYLYGNVTDKIRTELTFEIYWNTLSKSLLFATDKTITRSDSGGSFISDGFQVGDTFTIVGASLNSGSKTITAITATVITVAESLSSETVTCSIHGTTPVVALNYYYNLIENASPVNFNSLLDVGSSQRWNAAGLVTSTTGTTTAMFVGSASKAWSNFDCEVKTLSFDGYRQKLKITHNWLLSHYVPGQVPSEFTGNKCLKYIAKIDAKFDASNPNVDHTSSFNQYNGNTGWIDQGYNYGVTPVYSLESIKYTNSAGTIVDKLSYCEPTNVEIIIKYTDLYPALLSGFFNANTEVVLNQLYTPGSSTQYQNTSTDLRTNFRWDRKKTTVDKAAVNGDQHGTTLQSITNYTVTKLSTTKLRINYTSDLSSNHKDYIKNLPVSNRNYAILASISYGATGTTSQEYHNSVVCDLDSYECDKIDETLVQQISGVTFYEHPTIQTRGFTDFKGWVEDGVLSRNRFRLKTGAGAFLNKLTVQILAQSTTGSTSLSTLIISTGDQPNSIAYDSINNRMYVSNTVGQSITVIDCSDNSILTTISIGTLVSGIEYDPFHGRMYVSKFGTNSVCVIDCGSNTIIVNSISVGTGPQELKYNPENKKIYVCNGDSTTVSVIDTISNTVTSTITVGSGPIYIAYDSSNNRMYVSNLNDSTISVINCSSDSILTTISGFVGANGIAYDSFNSRIYLCSNDSSKILYVISCSSNSTIETIVMPYQPSSIVYDSFNNTMYVGSIVNAFVSLVDCITKTVVGTVACGNYNNNMAYNSLNNIIYVVNSTSDTVTALSINNPNSNVKEFLLEETIFDTSGIAAVSGVQPIILTGSTRGYHLVDADYRNYSRLFRNTSYDATNYSGYELEYAFKFRWEDWRTLLGVDPHFPDNNHDWQQYSKDANWDIIYRLTWDVEDSEETEMQFQHNANLGIYDYSDDAELIVFTESITTFSTDGLKNFQGRISKTENTLVKALFTGNFSSMPTGTTSFYGILALDNDPVGGVTYTRICSTQTNRESDSPWLGLPTDTDKARMTINGTSSVLVEAVIDYTKLDLTLPNYFITARLGYT